MGNLFDEYEKLAHDSVSDIMGDTAFWIPSDGSSPFGISANVLFSNPTKKKKYVTGVEFDPYAWQMEYYKDALPGLKALVDAGNVEIVTIKETEYYVQKVTTNWDGDISMAQLVTNTES